MKRFVYIPHEIKGEASLEQAHKLSESSSLQILSGTEGDGIGGDSVRIVAIPTKQSFVCDETVKQGFIHSIDIQDEFVDFSKGIVLRITSPRGEVTEVKPKMQETHFIRFRNRFNEPGIYSFYCIDSTGAIYYDGNFEVI